MSKLMYKPIRVYKSDINDEVEKLEKKQGVPKGVNSEKHERCVQSVKKDGKDKSSAYAICNASMKKAYSEDINDLVEGKVVKKSLADTLEGLSGEELKKAVENLDDSQKELLKSYLEELAKSKIVTRNGRRFYASGPSKGKEVGTVRGRSGKKQSESKRKAKANSGKVLWYDERDGWGVIEDSKGNKYYFDSSVLSEGFKPKRGAKVSFSSEKVGGVLAAQKVSGSKNESKPLDSTQTQDFLRIANEMEDRGDGFFDRHGKDATLWVRVKGDSHADNTQWPRANAIVEELSQAGIRANGPEIDRMSGHLRITVKDIYSSDN